jgi:hypothetical protein
VADETGDKKKRGAKGGVKHARPRSRWQERRAEKEAISEQSRPEVAGGAGASPKAMGRMGRVASRGAKVAARNEAKTAEADQ